MLRPLWPSTLVAGSLALLLAAAALLPAQALAQHTPRSWQRPVLEASDADIEEARALFVAGTEAVTAGRWADALASFERAYALTGVAAALYNLATTLRAVGRHVEARDAFAQFLADHPEAGHAVQAQARTLLAEESTRVAVLALVDVPRVEPLTLTLDGRVLRAGDARPLALDVDPGAHGLRLDVEGYEPWQWSGSLRDGEHREVRVVLERAPAPVEESRSLFAEPWFWIVSGAVVLAGVIVGAYLLWEGAQLDPLSPNVVSL